MHNAPVLQEERERVGGHEWHTCLVRVIFPKEKVLIRISVYMDVVRNIIKQLSQLEYNFFPNLLTDVFT